MDVMLERCAGIDIGKDKVVACVRTPGPGGRGRRKDTRSFRSFVGDLETMAEWFAAEGVTDVAMEATGTYWQPVWYVLEHGLLRGSFVPPRVIRELRDLTRYRKRLVQTHTSEVQRIQKTLDDGGIKLDSVASDVMGVSGRAMLRALVAGERDDEVLAELAKGKLRKKVPELRRALRGRFSEHHALLIGMSLDHTDHLEAAMARLDAQIDAVFAANLSEAGVPFERARDHLDTIPGVAKRAAEAIIAEISTDMARFPTAGHLASWAGEAPGNNITGGKRGSGRTTKGDVWARRDPQPVRMGGRSNPRHLPVRPVLASRPPDRQEESGDGGRPLDPGALPAPAHQRHRPPRPRRRLLHPPQRPRPTPRPPHRATPRTRLPSNPRPSRMNARGRLTVDSQGVR